MKTSKKLNWANTLFLGLSPLVAVALVILHVYLEGWNPSILIPALLLYIATGISITGGYHRLFAHRAYTAHPLIQFLYLIFGAAAFQNSLLKWADDHRRHHLHVDEDEDPYSIKKGFFYAHMGWILYKDNIDDFHYSKDLLKNKLVMWQHRYYLPIAIIVGFGLPTVVGYFMGSPLGGFAIAGLARIVLVHHCTFFINSLCHSLGKQPYNDQNTAKDSFVMALFTYGEGYHNYHHHFQTDYRNGIRWYDFDPTKWLIALLALFGLAKKLKKTRDEEILRAKIALQAKRALARAKWDKEKANIVEFRNRVENSIANFTVIRREYESLLRSAHAKKDQKLARLKLKLKLAKIEMDNSYQQWLLYSTSFTKIQMA